MSWLLRLGSKDTPHDPTPHVQGAQWLLAGHNVFKRTWYDGDLDGVVGQITADAFKTCKYDIGYPDSEVNRTFGPTLRDYLLGKKKRSPLMVLRARRRAAKFVFPTKPHGIPIGFPGVGTHSYVYPPNNWESDRAYDISVPLSTQIIAVADGTIGPQFGPLPDDDPRFKGIRLHLVTGDNEFYYAHLARTAPGIKPDAHVKQGDVLGVSGSANGVAHLHIGMKRLLPLSAFK